MFTKQHMIKIASIVRGLSNSKERLLLADEFAAMLGESNPRFNKNLFYAACRTLPPPQKCVSNKG